MFWKSWIGPLPQNWIDHKVAGNRTVSEKSSESLGTTKISISWHYLFLTLTFTKRCDDVTNLLFPPFVHFFSLSLLLYLGFEELLTPAKFRYPQISGTSPMLHFFSPMRLFRWKSLLPLFQISNIAPMFFDTQHKSFYETVWMWIRKYKSKKNHGCTIYWVPLGQECCQRQSGLMKFW